MSYKTTTRMARPPRISPQWSMADRSMAHSLCNDGPAGLRTARKRAASGLPKACFGKTYSVAEVDSLADAVVDAVLDAVVDAVVDAVLDADAAIVCRAVRSSASSPAIPFWSSDFSSGLRSYGRIAASKLSFSWARKRKSLDAFKITCSKTSLLMVSPPSCRTVVVASIHGCWTGRSDARHTYPVSFVTLFDSGRQEIHEYRFRSRFAHTAVQGILHGQTIQSAVAGIDLQHEWVRLGVLATDRPPAETAGAVCRRGADPALHLRPPLAWSGHGADGRRRHPRSGPRGRGSDPANPGSPAARAARPTLRPIPRPSRSADHR